MNKARRKVIEALIERVSVLSEEIETARDEEQEYYDNMPESFQNGQKGEDAESAISALSSAIDSLEEVGYHLGESIGQ